MKRLLLFFFCFPSIMFAQLCYDFESGSLENWNQSRDSAWTITDQNALCGSLSMWHRLDDSLSGEDRIFFAYDSLVLGDSLTSWSFFLRHGYNPSSSNKWAVYLLSEGDLSDWDFGDVGQTTGNRAIVLGVNYKGSDDVLKLWFTNGEKAEVFATTVLNWEKEIGTAAALLKVERKANGEWLVFLGRTGLPEAPANSLADTDTVSDWKMIGSGKETERVDPGYFGIQYRFSSRQDRKLWFDNLCISGIFRRDTTPPAISSLEARSETILRVSFSEAMDKVSVLSTGNYSVLPAGDHPVSIVPVSEISVDLVFGQAFVSGLQQVLRVEGTGDRKGNISAVMEAGFTWYNPLPGDVIFNEIMFDPLPPVRLPGYEYIELYNRSGYTISFKGWTLILGNRILAMPDYKLPAGEHLLICYREIIDRYPGAENVMDALSSMTMLSNEGVLLQLRDAGGLRIDWMEYSPEMHLNEYYAWGGWSLERIDPERKCHSIENWSTSTDRQGGSPGTENSIAGRNSDRHPPEPASIYLPDENSLILEFNESLEYGSAVQCENWFVDEGMGNPDSVSLPGPWNRELTLHYGTGFILGKEYCLKPDREIMDCSGNRIPHGTEFRFALPLQPKRYEVQISEVLFNPLPFCPDFIEIHNPTQKTFDIADLCLAGRDKETNEFTSVQRITQHRLLFPGEYLAFTEDPEELSAFFMVHDQSTIVRVNDMPAMGDIEGSVLLLDRYLGIVDEMAYHRNMHHPALPSPEGVSLEKIRFSHDPENSSDWYSASSTEGYGTPGRKNSQYLEIDQGDEGITVEPELFTPDMDGVEDFLVIRYSFSSPGCRARILVFYPGGRLVREIASGELLGTSGFYTWNGCDYNGKPAGSGMYLVFAEVSGVDGRIRRYRNVCVLSAGH